MLAAVDRKAHTVDCNMSAIAQEQLRDFDVGLDSDNSAILSTQAEVDLMIDRHLRVTPA